MSFIQLENNLEQQLFLLEFLSALKNPDNKRQKSKKTPFKVLNAIYLFTVNNDKKEGEKICPSLDELSKISKCCRRKTAEFIASDEIKIFCDVLHGKFRSNQYTLKKWVYDWLDLFWRIGMMKNFHTNHGSWFSAFKKKVKNFIIPQVHKGLGPAEILNGVMNKLSHGENHDN